MGECDCPQPADDPTLPGTAVRMPGRIHQRGCPEVQWIYDTQDRIAKDHAERFQGGGILPSPGEAEARRAQQAIDELRRRVDRLAEATDAEGGPRG